MILPWVVAAAALAVAVLAWAQARRTARRLDQLVQMYWELKYQHGELRTQLRQVTGETHQPGLSGVEGPARAPSVAGPAPGEAFVPLTSLRR
jgi:hypothetical protein